MSLRDAITFGIESASLFLEVAAAIVILWAAVHALIAWLATTWRRHMAEPPGGDSRHIRLRFGRALLFGLDLAVAGDLLRVSIAPHLEEALRVALVVGTRVALTLVIEHEMSRMRRSEMHDG